MPLTMMAFFIASLSIIGVPPAGGTWSKWFLLMGTIDSEQWILMVILMLSSLLNIAYLLPIPFHAFFSKDNSLPAEKVVENEGYLVNSQIKEAPLPALIAISLTTLGCLLLFIYPQPLFDLATSVLTNRN